MLMVAVVVSCHLLVVNVLLLVIIVMNVLMAWQGIH